MGKKLIFALVVGLFTLLSVGAVAQTFEELSDADKYRLIELIGRGNAAYDAGDYSESCAHYEDAAEMAEFPEVYYRLALCRERLDELGRAVEAYERYLDLDPEISDRGRIVAELERLKRIMVERSISHLRIRSSPEGATVLGVDGKDLGETPLDLELEPGMYQFFLRAPGRVDGHRTVELEAGGSSEIHVEMERIAVLRVTSDPPNTEVWLGGMEGELVGKTPVELEVKPGEHLVVLVREDFPPQARRVEVEQGRLVELDVTMVREIEEVSGGWLSVVGWTSLGLAVLAGGATGGAWLATESKIDEFNGYDRTDPENSREGLSELRADVDRWKRRTWLSGAAAGALTVTGAAFFWMGSRRGSDLPEVEVGIVEGGAYGAIRFGF